MPRQRDALTRRIAITARLRQVMVLYLDVSSDSITTSTPLGEKFHEILDLVAIGERRTKLQRTGPMRSDSTFLQAVEFLMTVVQE